MFKLPYLRVDFDLPIGFDELSAFRGAIAAKVGREHVLFHQHYQDEAGEERRRQAYSLIQYKRLYGCASMICLGEGVEEISHFFGLESWQIQMGRRQIDLKISKLQKKEYELSIIEEGSLYTYSLQNWLGLNQENYATFKEIGSLRRRVEKLEGVLTGHLLHFLEGIGWEPPKRFDLEIADVEPMYVMPYKGVPLSAFSLTFRTNLFLPSYIGLGKGASRGFGVVKFLPRKGGGA